MSDGDDEKPKKKRGKPKLTVVGGKDEGPAERVGRALKDAKPVPPAEPREDETGEPPAAGSEPPKKLSKEDAARAKECAMLDQNDRDNARRLCIWHGEDICFVVGMGWLVWNSRFWEMDQGELAAALKAQGMVDYIKMEARFIELSRAERKLIEEAETIRKKSDADRNAFERAMIANADRLLEKLTRRRDGRWKFAISSGNATRTNAMLAQARAQRTRRGEELDADPLKISVADCTLVFSTAKEDDPDASDSGEGRITRAKVEIVPHDRAHLITRACIAAYDPAATAPAFMEFLAHFQPDEKLRRLLQVRCGYALAGGNNEQVMFFDYGPGANGKTVFNETVGRILGGYRAVANPETVSGDGQRSGSGPSPDIARLVNARLVTIEELPRGTPLKENFVKSLTGGAPMLARFNYKEFFEFNPRFVAVMTGNEKPVILGGDHGIWRRIVLVPWQVIIPEEERLPFGQVIERHMGEASGILNWMIEGALAYLCEGLSSAIPEVVRKATADYRDESDPIGSFARNCLLPRPGNRLEARTVFDGYTKWCEANAIKPFSEVRFSKRLAALGYKKELGKVRVYVDVILAELPSRHDPGESWRRSPGGERFGDAIEEGEI